MVVKFSRKIKKYGGSYVFAIPKDIIKHFALKIDDEVLVSVEGDRMIVEKDVSVHDG